MYMYSNFIVQQTLPGRIHPPGSICLRHLGELLPIFSFCSCLRGIEKYQFDSVNSKIPAVMTYPKERDDSDECFLGFCRCGCLVFVGERLGWMEQIGRLLGQRRLQNWFSFLEQAGKPLHTAGDQW